MQNIIAIENGVTRHPLYRMKEPVNMTLAAGEHIAVVGRNGAGKSILVDTITGRWPLLMNEVKYDFSPSPSKMAYENIKYIAFRDSYGDSDGNYYYQQRWNAHDLLKAPSRMQRSSPSVRTGQMAAVSLRTARQSAGSGRTRSEDMPQSSLQAASPLFSSRMSAPSALSLPADPAIRIPMS